MLHSGRSCRKNGLGRSFGPRLEQVRLPPWANIKVKEACNLDKVFALDTPEQSCVILESASLELCDERHLFRS